LVKQGKQNTKIDRLIYTTSGVFRYLRNFMTHSAYTIHSLAAAFNNLGKSCLCVKFF